MSLDFRLVKVYVIILITKTSRYFWRQCSFIAWAKLSWKTAGVSEDVGVSFDVLLSGYGTAESCPLV